MEKAIATFVAGGLIVGGASTFAYAALVDGSGAIHACVGNLTGAVRIVNVDKTAPKCRLGETPLVWNQTGPMGPAGPTGPQGPAGATTLSSARVIEATFVASPGGERLGIVECPAATPNATGGGYFLNGPGGDPTGTNLRVLSDDPSIDTNGHAHGWGVVVFNDSPQELSFGVDVDCAP